VKGKNCLIEYYKKPDLTAQAVDQEGYLYTGDLGQVNEKGYVTFVGRKTDMIVSGGFNVFPLELEEILCKLPSVALVAVVGMPDTELGETVCACVVLRDGMTATQEEIIEYCRKQMANYKVPKRVEFMESLPTTIGTNKIKKTDLKEILKGGK
jgi:acyl-CoA synthetase (AMP-forming)/AMP-acid ligase II